MSDKKICKEVQDEIVKIKKEAESFSKGCGMREALGSDLCNKDTLCDTCQIGYSGAMNEINALKTGAKEQLKVDIKKIDCWYIQKIRTQQKEEDMKIMKKLIKQMPFPNEEEQKKIQIGSGDDLFFENQIIDYVNKQRNLWLEFIKFTSQKIRTQRDAEWLEKAKEIKDDFIKDDFDKNGLIAGIGVIGNPLVKFLNKKKDVSNFSIGNTIKTQLKCYHDRIAKYYYEELKSAMRVKT